MQDSNNSPQLAYQANEAQQQQQILLLHQQLQQAKLNALQQALGSNKFFHGTDFRDFLTNGDWQHYQYLTSRVPDPFGVSGTNRYLSANLPEYHLINRIRNAQDLDEVNRQLSLWKQYDPLNAPANIRNYIRMKSVGSVGTRPQFNINEPEIGRASCRERV